MLWSGTQRTIWVCSPNATVSFTVTGLPTEILEAKRKGKVTLVQVQCHHVTQMQYWGSKIESIYLCDHARRHAGRASSVCPPAHGTDQNRGPTQTNRAYNALCRLPAKYCQQSVTDYREEDGPWAETPILLQSIPPNCIVAPTMNYRALT